MPDDEDNDSHQQQWENEYQQWLAEQGVQDEGDFDE